MIDPYYPPPEIREEMAALAVPDRPRPRSEVVPIPIPPDRNEDDDFIDRWESAVMGITGGRRRCFRTMLLAFAGGARTAGLHHGLTMSLWTLVELTGFSERTIQKWLTVAREEGWIKLLTEPHRTDGDQLARTWELLPRKLAPHPLNGLTPCTNTMVGRGATLHTRLPKDAFAHSALGQTALMMAFVINTRGYAALSGLGLHRTTIQRNLHLLHAAGIVLDDGTIDLSDDALEVVAVDHHTAGRHAGILRHLQQQREQRAVVLQAWREARSVDPLPLVESPRRRQWVPEARHPTACRSCTREIEVGERILWFPEPRAVFCHTCGSWAVNAGRKGSNHG